MISSLIKFSHHGLEGNARSYEKALLLWIRGEEGLRNNPHYKNHEQFLEIICNAILRGGFASQQEMDAIVRSGMPFEFQCKGIFERLVKKGGVVLV